MTKFLFVPLILLLSFQACQNTENNGVEEISMPEHDTTHAADYASDNFMKEQGVEFVQEELDFGKLLLDLESQFGWENVEDFWKLRRDEWVLDCQNAISYQDKSALLIEFENIIQRNYLDEGWKKIRINWMDSCKKATSNNELGRHLIELDANILWNEISPNWPLKRSDWFHACREL